MTRLSNTIIVLLGTSLVPSSMAFSSMEQQAKKQQRRSISWSEYKHDFIDPIASGQGHDSNLEGHMDPAQRQSSDQFWLAYYAQEKERLHELNSHASAQQQESSSSSSSSGLPRSASSKVTSYDVYKSKYLDPMLKNEAHPSGLDGPHLDPETRASADEFWLQVVLEEKAKLHGKSSATP
ncbi:unnamed protein product [Cylindrotheca closterium]|uniref:Uncharacterized protein n=1 Tax=Cylindrotheca closterium TaxID=2856 RepID=A0AAD2CLI3_9STRA|nr:unnamed protein product [Cylindrotheca closterium]